MFVRQVVDALLLRARRSGREHLQAAVGQGAQPVIDLGADPRGVSASEAIIRVVTQDDGDTEPKI